MMMNRWIFFISHISCLHALAPITLQSRLPQSQPSPIRSTSFTHSNNPTSTTTLFESKAQVESEDVSIYETIAKSFFSTSQTSLGEGTAFTNGDCEEVTRRLDDTRAYTNTVSLLRVGIPSLFLAASAKISYTPVSLELANIIQDSGVFAVVAQDASQYIQNILTTSGLMFSILVGQTYYFMYQQQEAIYLALFEEVTMAKSLLEQVA
ncbi:MAG: hypothetical protein SGARI_005901, partial [Bacillariaceae sp.]